MSAEDDRTIIYLTIAIIVMVVVAMAIHGCAPSLTPRPPCDTAEGQYQQLVWTGTRFVECGEL